MKIFNSLSVLILNSDNAETEITNYGMSDFWSLFSVCTEDGNIFHCIVNNDAVRSLMPAILTSTTAIVTLIFIFIQAIGRLAIASKYGVDEKFLPTFSLADMISKFIKVFGVWMFVFFLAMFAPWFRNSIPDAFRQDVWIDANSNFVWILTNIFDFVMFLIASIIAIYTFNIERTKANSRKMTIREKLKMLFAAILLMQLPLLIYQISTFNQPLVYDATLINLSMFWLVLGIFICLKHFDKNNNGYIFGLLIVSVFGIAFNIIFVLILYSEIYLSAKVIIIFVFGMMFIGTVLSNEQKQSVPIIPDGKNGSIILNNFDKSLVLLLPYTKFVENGETIFVFKHGDYKLYPLSEEFDVLQKRAIIMNSSWHENTKRKVSHRFNYYFLNFFRIIDYDINDEDSENDNDDNVIATTNNE